MLRKWGEIMINNELTTKRKYELEQTIESNNDEFIEIDKSLSLSYFF